MNFNLEKYEKAEAKEFGDFERLELGGHEVVIVNAKEYTSEQSGKTSLKISVDIAKGDEQEGFFKKQYEDAKRTAEKPEDVKWSSGGTKYLSLADEQIEYLKGFITAVENSNKGFKFDPKGEWSQLKDKKLAAQFGLEEYEYNGEKKVATKLIRFRSLDKLKEITIPDVKVLTAPNTYDYITYEDYLNRKKNTTSNTPSEDTIVLTDDDLPF